MRRAATRWAMGIGILVSAGFAPQAQPAFQSGAPAASPSSSQAISAMPAQPAPAVTGGRLHGTAKSGSTPLPGVTVTAANSLTGKRFSTTTDITGAWSMTIPQNGRYVIRTQFAAFATGAQESLLNAASHDQAINFEL